MPFYTGYLPVQDTRFDDGADAPHTLTNLATSYFLLAPWNYNDYDVSMESQNSVIINQNGDYQVEERVRSHSQCVPPPQGRVEYHPVIKYTEGGEVAKPEPGAESFRTTGGLGSMGEYGEESSLGSIREVEDDGVCDRTHAQVVESKCIVVRNVTTACHPI